MSDITKIVLGASGMIEQPRRLSGGRFKPTQITRVWKGPKAAAYAMIPLVRLFDWTLDEDGPNATVSITTPDTTAGQGGEQPVDTWELQSPVVDKDILDSQVEAVVAMGDDNRQKIRAALNSNTTPTFANPTQAPAILATAIYKLMNKGARSSRVFAPVLKRTRTVTNSYATVQAVGNVGRIIRTATLIGNGTNSEGVPADFLVSLATAPFTSTDPTVASDESALLYGWFKMAPGLQVAANSRLQITQEWEFGLWPQVLFPGGAL